MSDVDPVKLAGFTYCDLRDVSGLRRLDDAFLLALEQRDPALRAQLLDYRSCNGTWTPLEVSTLLLAAAPYLEDFIARLFGLNHELAASQAATLFHDPVMAFKEEFVARRARRVRGGGEDFAALDAWLRSQLPPDTDRELAVARFGMALLQTETQNAEAIERLTHWCAAALRDPQAHGVATWISFKLPHRLDHAKLVPLQRADDIRAQAPAERLRRRDGFTLTDPRGSAREVQDQVHYCIYCHRHDGDFCSKGFPEKKGQPELGFKTNPLGVTLTGCPLEEKISEMHALKREGRTIGALAVAMADNPMVPATGHRICNDCMKGCIYQKQDPVDIPQIETRVLTDVLALPWGVEIYDLLTRWNPLRREQYLPKPYNGRKVLIAGMGPAGFSMAHHLTMEGCAVVGIDGLKIEPLPPHLLDQPIRDWDALVEPLDERILLGFGGVAEYGITVRWDKNFLKLIYLTLARRPLFQVHGGVRLGGTVKIEDAWELGFDHVCIATGTGLPRVLNIPNSLARGMRQASDFLMALQLTGAAKKTSIANLQVRLPAIVIGGGLTAVDTATEVQAYYIKQVEKVLARHERLVAQFGEERTLAGLSPEDIETLHEFLAHGRAARAERERAARAGEAPNFIELVRGWGGVTLTYRKGMNTSPAYTRNHEELSAALEEGIYYAEGLEPLLVETDGYAHVEAVVFRRMAFVEGAWLATDEEVRMPARSIFVAAGAMPNVIYEQEHEGTLRLEGDHFLAHVAHPEGLQPVQTAAHNKADEFGAFTSYRHDGRTVTFIGDTNPSFQGSVVQAIASAKRTYPLICAALERLPQAADERENYRAFRERVADLLTPRVAHVDHHNPAVVELWIKAPLAARNFKPGQFFRLQTYESSSPIVAGTRLQVPVLTVSGTGVENDKIRLMVLQWGAAPRLAGRLAENEPLVLMGPTGAPTEIPRNETVMVIAGRWGAAVMLDIGPALREAGNKVIYLAAFTRADEVDYQSHLEEGSDQIIWCTAREPLIPARRPQDLSVAATDMVDLVSKYGAGKLKNSGGGELIPLQSVDRIMVMGSTGLLRGFQQALENGLKKYFPNHLVALGTVGSPMQCMLKGVCAQCLQWQIDPATGLRTRAVFSCAQQDQPLSWIDLDNLAARQAQNRLLDRQTAMWMDAILP